MYDSASISKKQLLQMQEAQEHSSFPKRCIHSIPRDKTIKLMDD